MADATTTADKKTYRGNCHCGAFIFEATIPEITELMACNCSICYKKNYALHFASTDDFKIVKGDLKDLTTYRFGGRNLNHMFCPTCGVAVVANHGGMPNMIGFNLRAVQGPIDVWNLPKKPYDGKALKPDYSPPSFADLPDPAPDMDGQVYHGSCHCGDVRLAMKLATPIGAAPAPAAASTPAPLMQITECNCSICQRTGATWIYPPRSQVGIHSASPSDEPRSYPLVVTKKQFCSRCGVFVASPFNFETDEEFARLPEAVRTYFADKRHILCVNLRLFQDVDVGKLEDVHHFDGWNHIKPAYVNP